MIRVVLPHHLRTLANVRKEVELDVEGPITPRAILDALEAKYPVLRGSRHAAAPFVGALLCLRARFVA